MKVTLLFIIILLCISAYSVYSQDVSNESGESQKSIKELRIERRNAEEARMSRMTDSLITNRRFVLEANYLSTQYASRMAADNLNFILVDSGKIIIQMGTNQRLGGNNGLGGITVDGKINTFETKKTGKGEGHYLVKITTITPLGTYDITIHISPNSVATAFINGLLDDKVSYHGVIRPLEKSTIYKGRSL